MSRFALFSALPPLAKLPMVTFMVALTASCEYDLFGQAGAIFEITDVVKAISKSEDANVKIKFHPEKQTR